LPASSLRVQRTFPYLPDSPNRKRQLVGAFVYDGNYRTND
jgi:hypothetical protein